MVRVSERGGGTHGKGRELIPNEKLRLSDVPDENADIFMISPFALTFGYADSPANHSLFSETRRTFLAGSANLNELSLTDLRTCLFLEQRLHKWSSDNPDYKPDLRYMHALVSAIRANLTRV